MNNVEDQVSTNGNPHTNISTTSEDEILDNEVCTETDCENHSRLVPVSEAKKYRKRAQNAEQQLRELSGNLKTLELELDTTHSELASIKTQQQINDLLCSAGAIDPELARLAVEDSIKNMSAPDLKSVVSDLKRSKPYLFYEESVKVPGQGSMTATLRLRNKSGKSVRHHITSGEAAQQAMKTGKQTDLLRYMQLRRLSKQNGQI